MRCKYVNMLSLGRDLEKNIIRVQRKHIAYSWLEIRICFKKEMAFRLVLELDDKNEEKKFFFY